MSVGHLYNPGTEILWVFKAVAHGGTDAGAGPWMPAAGQMLERVCGCQRMRSGNSNASATNGGTDAGATSSFVLTATSGNATGLCSGRGRRNRTGRQANRNGTPAPAHAPAPPANAPAARSPLPHNTSTPAKAHVPNMK